MKKLYYLMLLFIVISTLFSCSDKVYFTRQIKGNLLENKLDIGKVQFYNSSKIELKRNLSSEETKIAKGKITYENGQFVETVIIPKLTPGVALDVGSDFVNVSFDSSSDDYMIFKCNDNDQFQVTAREWNDRYGKVVYDTTIYYMTAPSGKARLKVEKNYITNYKKKKKVLKGRKVSYGYE